LTLAKSWIYRNDLHGERMADIYAAVDSTELAEGAISIDQLLIAGKKATGGPIFTLW